MPHPEPAPRAGVRARTPGRRATHASCVCALRTRIDNVASGSGSRRRPSIVHPVSVPGAERRNGIARDQATPAYSTTNGFGLRALPNGVLITTAPVTPLAGTVTTIKCLRAAVMVPGTPPNVTDFAPDNRRPKIVTD